MLIREGFNRGTEPTLPVLEISTNKKRNPSDLLPYLGDFAHWFAALPNEYSELSLRISIVPISDIECVTETVIKSDGPFKALNDKKETMKLANDQFIPLCASWGYRDWEEVNWRKIKDMALQNLLDARQKAAEGAQNRKCLTCPKFLQHFTMQHDEWLIKENIAALRQLMSDQNLQLLPDYEQRISVLKELGFVDENSRVELKGKVAGEVRFQPWLTVDLAWCCPSVANWRFYRFTQRMSSFSLSLFLRTSSPIMSRRRLLRCFRPLSSRRRRTWSRPSPPT
jgi:antiviral helicase SKI2